MSSAEQLDALLAAGRPSSMSRPRLEGLQNFTELARWLAGPGSGPAGEDIKIDGPAGAGARTGLPAHPPSRAAARARPRVPAARRRVLSRRRVGEDELFSSSPGLSTYPEPEIGR